jgi:hypothetical protein
VPQCPRAASDEFDYFDFARRLSAASDEFDYFDFARRLRWLGLRFGFGSFSYFKIVKKSNKRC